MEIKFVGPKAIISKSGISFDNNKDDKSIYLNCVVQLIVALDHDYIEDKTYVYDNKIPNLSSDEIIKTIKKYTPKIEKTVEEWKEHTEKEVEHELDRASWNKILAPIEREVLIKNITMMKDYNVQRTINKSFYYAAVEILADIVKRDHIDYIIVPMLPEHTHVLHSLQGSMQKLKFPIDSKMEIYNKDGEFFSKLKVVTIGSGLNLV
ncbi:MAG: hypothetical protein GQ570_02505 [Helicobacteraceae bacterium]|nr:hypothetical protein [Helicobacteraceae bacterium]